MSKLELLAPAGDFEKLKVAFNYGADAVYVGLKDLSLRANAKNFNYEELKEAIDYTHRINKKIYVALNIYFTPEEANKIIESLNILNELKPDGIIISDLGLLYLVRKYSIKIPVHISTQANTTNQYATMLYKELGVSRIILARELSLSQIKEIKNSVDIELEAFVHGAMCISYSGRCILSAYMTTKNLGARENDDGITRSANKGDCSHSCRWEFILKEKNRKDQDFEIEEDERGTYVLSSKDLCMIRYIKELAEAGVTLLKIEGRMKSILYISSIVRAYRVAIDCYINNREPDFDFINKELNIVSHREFSTGFFFENPIKNANITHNLTYIREYRLGAMVIGNNKDKAILKIYNSISKDDIMEYISPVDKTYIIKNIDLFDKDGSPVNRVNHSQYVEAIIYDQNGKKIKTNEMDIIRILSNF
ncbi:MAG TPA: U32 family peptidase [Spirochaetota bacterium]|nr:U32 family peptidase [Spirochaetota bacterium]